MKTNIKYLILLPAMAAIALFASSCEDAVPSDYTPDTIVEAFLLVDHPIENITILQTQPLNKTFIYDSSLIKDAKVTISTDTDSWLLSFRGGENPGYFFPDTSVKIMPETKYYLEIVMPDYSVMTGETVTPKRFNWIVPPKDFIQYPTNVNNPPFVDSLVFSWERVPGMEYYLISAVCLDTLEYGKYLSPPTDDKNERVYRPNANEERYLEFSTWAFLPTTVTPIVWNFFKWFGKHKTVVYAADPNMLRWFQQYLITGAYDPLLNSIEGGKGCFGSASTASKIAIVLKNLPE